MKVLLLMLRHHILKCKSQFYIRIMKPDHSITYFEGGLGSQILSLIEFANKQLINKNRARIDTTYFKDNITFRAENGLTHWEWKLDHYGIRLSDINQKIKIKIKEEKKEVLDMRRKTIGAFGNVHFVLRKPTRFESVKYIVEKKLWTVPEWLYGYLPILSTQSERDSIFFDGVETIEYGVIHVRKGDYLNVASRILGVNELLPFLKKIKNILPNKVIFVTDGIFEVNEKMQIEIALCGGGVDKVTFHEGAIQRLDQTIVHDLMRSAKVLVTSNSTFSFTAGLLNTTQDSVVFVPLDFYGDLSNDESSPFRLRTTFGLLEDDDI